MKITEHPPQIILSLDTAAIRGKRQVFDRLFCIGLHADPLVETDAEPELRFRKRGRRRLAETLDRRGRIPRGAGAIQGTISKIEFGQRRARLHDKLLDAHLRLLAGGELPVPLALLPRRRAYADRL